jgi:hypothetical protein
VRFGGAVATRIQHDGSCGGSNELMRRWLRASGIQVLRAANGWPAAPLQPARSGVVSGMLITEWFN